MAHTRDHFAKWLRDAHAMEEQGLSMLTAQSRRIESYPDLKACIDRHQAETREHVQALQGLLDRLPEGGASRIRDLAGRLAAAAQGLGGALTNDEVIRGAMAGYAFEHVEIGVYRVLIAAADELEEEEAKAVFERILEEELVMASWLGSNLDDMTRVFLMRDERELQAKR